jgi:hypothetical protein
VVRGVVPAAADASLPASLRELVLEGAWCEQEQEDPDGQHEANEADEAAVEAWLASGRLPSLQQLQLKGLVGDSYFYKLDFSGLPGLRDLRFLLSGPEIFWHSVAIPYSLSTLSNLEVLQLGVSGQHRFPGRVPAWYMGIYEADTLAKFTKLRSLGYVAHLPDISPDEDFFEVHFPQLSSLQLVVEDERLPDGVDPSCFPSLQHLVVQCEVVKTSMVQRLAQLTTLTCLQLNTGSRGFYKKTTRSREGGWCGLEALSHSLHLLRRLELVNCFGFEQRGADSQGRDTFWFPLSIPNLSTFTQLKQLQLACSLVPEDPYSTFFRLFQPKQLDPRPPRPSPAEFIAGLSKLTQLEQLEVLGYSSVTPGLLTDLVSCLPGLRALEVGLCRHPSLIHVEEQQAVGTMEGATGSGIYGDCESTPVDQGFAQASRACEGLRPGLRVQVGYAPQ